MASASSSHGMPRPRSSLSSSHGTYSSTVIAARTPSERRCCRDHRHAAWRHMDSSEKTPSTASSDNDIAPAELVITRTASLQSRGETGNSQPQDRPASATTTYSAQLADTTTEGTCGTLDTLGSNPWAAASSSSSRHNASVERTRQHDEQGETSDCTQNREFARPSLYPLEPRYQPPQRRPTPPGVPSYEATQQSLESRLALRRRGVVDGGPGGQTRPRVHRRDANGSAGDGAGAGNRGSFSFSTWRRRNRPLPSTSAPTTGPTRNRTVSRSGRLGLGFGLGRRRSQAQNGVTSSSHQSQRSSNGFGGGGHELRTLPPIWRPPASQHATGTHPLAMMDSLQMPDFSTDTAPAQPPRPPSTTVASIPVTEVHGEEGGHLPEDDSGGETVREPELPQPDGTLPSTAEEEAEREAWGGRSPRPVTLEDYAFLGDRDASGGEPSPNTGGVVSSTEEGQPASMPAPTSHVPLPGPSVYAPPNAMPPMTAVSADPPPPYEEIARPAGRRWRRPIPFATLRARQLASAPPPAPARAGARAPPPSLYACIPCWLCLPCWMCCFDAPPDQEAVR